MKNRIETLRAAALAALALGAAAAGAQTNGPAATVDVESIVRAALAHHPAMEAADRRVAAADARHDGADAERRPRLEFGVRAGHFEGLEDSTLGPGVMIPAIDDRYGAGASLRQPLYTGGRVDSQRRGSNFDRQAARADALALGADLALQSRLAYWTWSKAWHEAAALDDAVRRVQAHAANLRSQRAAGLATDHEQLAAEVLADQTALLREDARRGEQRARARIAWLTGTPLPPEARPDTAGPDDAPVPAEDELLKRAVAHRPECAAAALRVQAAETAVQTARATFRPQIDAEARYEYLRPNTLEIPPRDEWMDDAYAGLSASWNLFDAGRTRARVDEARAAAGAAKAALDLAEEQARFDAREARIALAGAIERSTVAARAEQSARLELEAVQSQWRNGLARSSEVLDAHSRLTQAEAQRIAARADVRIARASVARAAGEPAEAGRSGKADE